MFASSSKFLPLGWLLFTLSWLAFDHYQPWINFHSELLAFLGLLIVWMGVLARCATAIPFPHMGLWIGIATLLPWLQYVAGIVLFGGDALLSSLYLTGLLVAVHVGYCLSKPDGLMHSLWVAAMASAAIGLAQWFNVEGHVFGMAAVGADLGDRAMGNMGQANQLATLLLMGMVALAWVFEQRIIQTAAFSLGIVFMTMVLVLTQSRAGLLGGLLAVSYLAWSTWARNMRISTAFLAAWAASLVCGTLMLPWVAILLRGEGVRGLQAAAPVSERLLMWQQFLSAIAESPWLGFGWNQGFVAQTVGAVAYPSNGVIISPYAHNFVLDMIAWCGVPLGFVLVAGIAYWLLSRLRACLSGSGNGVGAGAEIYAMACLLPLVVHSLLEYPFAYAYFLIPGGLLVGLVEAGTYPATRITVPHTWVWFFAGLVIPVGIFSAYEYGLIEEDFRSVRFEQLHMDYAPDSYKPPEIYLVTQLGALLKAQRLSVTTHMTEQDLELLHKVAKRYPDGALRCKLAMAMSANKHAAKAQQQMDIIRSLYSKNYYATCQSQWHRVQPSK